MRFRFFTVIFVCLSTTLQAQTRPAPPPIPRFTLRACALGFTNLPELYWLDLQVDAYGTETREYQPLQIEEGLRGAAAEIPLRPPLNLYRKVVSQEGEIRMEPAVKIPPPRQDGQLLFLMYITPEKERAMLFINESAEDHPPRNVRVINLSNQHMAVSIGGKPVAISAGQNRNLGVPHFSSPGKFTFTYGIPKENGAWTSPQKNLRFRNERDRLLVLYTLLPKYEDPTGEGKRSRLILAPTAYRLYDRVPETRTAKPDAE
ncbi:hypothetical protein P0Y35_09780 [Kiritimatiellaeota bacterium B1221]|nr:hypothetical protein [Kiritimatiellaeota bacterium B1221]